jgi:hypothetical protein
MFMYIFQCYEHQIRCGNLENLLNLQEQSKPQCIGPIHQDMIWRNVNLMFIDRSEGCYVFHFLCIRHACCSGAIASKLARPVTWSASPKSCTPRPCHDFLEWRSYRCVRDVQIFKGYRIVTASLKNADHYRRYPKTPVLRNLWHWMDENAAPYLLPALVG